MADAVKTPDNLTTQLVEWFESSEEATDDARALSEKSRDYYDNKQWTSVEKQTLDKRKQPALVFNHIKRKVNFLTGFEAQNKADPKAYPRNAPADEGAANAATDSIRYVVDKEDCAEKFSSVWENMLIEGFGGVEVLYDAEKEEIEIKQWPWDRLFADPHSSKPDFSDAKYKGGVVWLDEDDARAKYPSKEALNAITITVSDSSKAETYDDKPRHKVWASGGKRKRIRVVQIYWRVGKEWHWAHYTKGGILDGNKPVIFKDDEGGSECPLIMQSAYVDRDNNRYGEVVELLDRQDEINKRRSKLLHLMSVRQVQAQKGAVDNVNRARNELSRPDGWVETNPGKEMSLLDTSDMTAGQASLLAEAKAEMEGAGPNAALQGKQGDSASGRAIIASQQGGIAELGALLARYKNFRLRVYRQIWNRIRQFWTGERWIRVTDDERNMKFVALNRKITARMQVVERAEQAGDALGVEFAKVADDPALDEVVAVENNTAEMDMDIILDEGPDSITIRQEQFELVMKLAQSMPGAFDPEDIIELSDLRNKDAVLDRLKEKREQGNQSPENELKLMGEKAKADKDAAQAQKSQAEAEGVQLENAVNAAVIEEQLQ